MYNQQKTLTKFVQGNRITSELGDWMSSAARRIFRRERGIKPGVWLNYGPVRLFAEEMEDGS